VTAINDLDATRSVKITFQIVVMFRVTLTESDRVSRKTKTIQKKTPHRSMRVLLLDAILRLS
jgi:hypothetical protein